MNIKMDMILELLYLNEVPTSDQIGNITKTITKAVIVHQIISSCIFLFIQI